MYYRSSLSCGLYRRVVGQKFTEFSEDSYTSNICLDDEDNLYICLCEKLKSFVFMKRLQILHLDQIPWGNSALQLATLLATGCILYRHTCVLVFFPVLHLFTEKYRRFSLHFHVAVTVRAVGHLQDACPFSRNTFLHTVFILDSLEIMRRNLYQTIIIIYSSVPIKRISSWLSAYINKRCTICYVLHRNCRLSGKEFHFVFGRQKVLIATR
jgi:hypothetical protein